MCEWFIIDALLGAFVEHGAKQDDDEDAPIVGSLLS